MKQLVAIIFSLLLIVAQTFAVKAPVSGGVSVAKRSCCGEGCDCCVSQSGAPSAPPVESTAPAAAQNQFIFLPVVVVTFPLPAPVNEFSFASNSTDFPAAASSIFRRNCTLLI